MTQALHPLLGRLLRRLGASTDEVPSLDAWQGLLALISRTYQEADRDRYTLERSIEISSREMQGLYEELKRQSESELAAERQRVMQSLAILRATLEATVDGILVVDQQRRVVAANRRVGEMLRIPDEIMDTRDHRKLVASAAAQYPDPRAMIEEVERLHASRSVLHDEMTLKDGRTIDRYSAPVTLLDGAVVGRVTFMRDITVERNAHAQLERARVDAEAASQAKSNFLANMSHELRTPLNAVIGLSDLLLIPGGDPVSKRQHDYLEGIVTSGRHLLSMVNDVLDLAKIEAGKHQLEIEQVGPQDAIEEAVHLLQPIAQSRGVALDAQIEPETPHIKADPIRLRQILYNLISNAVKFTNREGKVRVSACVDTRGVAIRVSDTGIGIAPEDITRLFRAFEQVNLPSGDRPGGTGLGLALTKQLVDMHGGSIDVTSQVGRGTTFTVRLPVA